MISLVDKIFTWVILIVFLTILITPSIKYFNKKEMVLYPIFIVFGTGLPIFFLIGGTQ